MTKGVQHLSGEIQSCSDIDFYIDGVRIILAISFPVAAIARSSSPPSVVIIQDMIHIADTKVARRYGDFFIRQIYKLEEVRGVHGQC